jgi:hypothetical protein
MTIETIVRAAITIDNGVWSVPPPGRHTEAMWLYSYGSAEQPRDGMPDVPVRKGTRFVAPKDQGFLTSLGRFVNRREAKVIAVAAGQYRNAASSSARHGATHGSNELYSEDLW